MRSVGQSTQQKDGKCGGLGIVTCIEMRLVFDRKANFPLDGCDTDRSFDYYDKPILDLTHDYSFTHISLLL